MSGGGQPYKGYKKIVGTSDEINAYMSNHEGWAINEYLIIENTDTGKSSEMRFNGNDFVSLKLPPSKFIKGKNAQQRCALDMLFNKDIPICVLMGEYGSGKSFLSMQMALYAIREGGTQARILGVREPRGEGRELGYLPGDFNQKNEPWTLPLVQQLNGGDWELNSLRDRGQLEFNIPTYMKGTSYAETIMVIDEAEDLTKKQLKMIGTRVGNNSRIFFDGDYRQSANGDSYSPLLQMCELLRGNPLFACVTLEEDVRSETSRLFASLFED